MPFGHRNTSQIFQHYIEVLEMQNDFYVAYIDDILILSKIRSEHGKHIQHRHNEHKWLSGSRDLLSLDNYFLETIKTKVHHNYKPTQFWKTKTREQS